MCCRRLSVETAARRRYHDPDFRAAGSGDRAVEHGTGLVGDPQNAGGGGAISATAGQGEFPRFFIRYGNLPVACRKFRRRREQELPVAGTDRLGARHVGRFVRVYERLDDRLGSSRRAEHHHGDDAKERNDCFHGLLLT